MCAGPLHDNRVSPNFQADKQQGQNRKGELQPFRALLPAADLPLPPLSRGPRAKAPNPCKYGQVDKRTHSRQQQHGDANCVLVKPAYRCKEAAGDGKGREADSQSDTADREYSGAYALQRRHQQAGAGSKALSPLSSPIGLPMPEAPRRRSRLIQSSARWRRVPIRKSISTVLP